GVAHEDHPVFAELEDDFFFGKKFNVVHICCETASRFLKPTPPENLLSVALRAARPSLTTSLSFSGTVCGFKNLDAVSKICPLVGNGVVIRRQLLLSLLRDRSRERS